MPIVSFVADPLEDLRREVYDEDVRSKVDPEQVTAAAPRHLDFVSRLNFASAVKRSEVPKGRRFGQHDGASDENPSGERARLCSTGPTPLLKQKPVRSNTTTAVGATSHRK